MTLIITPSAMTKPVSLFTNKTFEISLITAVEVEAVESLVAACEGMCQLGFNFKVLPKGDDAWQEACFDLAQSYPENFMVLEAVASNQEVALKNSQVVLFSTTPTKTELKMLQKKGLIAVLPWPACEAYPNMMTFDAQKESGNCFFYTPAHTWDLVANMVRAFENYKFSYDWGQLKKRWKDTPIG